MRKLWIIKQYLYPVDAFHYILPLTKNTSITQKHNIKICIWKCCCCLLEFFFCFVLYLVVFQEMVDWFNAIRAARFHYLQVAFPGANDEEVRATDFTYYQRYYLKMCFQKCQPIGFHLARVRHCLPHSICYLINFGATLFYSSQGLLWKLFIALPFQWVQCGVGL